MLSQSSTTLNVLFSCTGTQLMLFLLPTLILTKLKAQQASLGQQRFARGGGGRLGMGPCSSSMGGHGSSSRAEIGPSGAANGGNRRRRQAGTNSSTWGSAAPPAGLF